MRLLLKSNNLFLGYEEITIKHPDGENWLNAKVKIPSANSRNAIIKISVNSGRLNINRLAISNK